MGKKSSKDEKLCGMCGGREDAGKECLLSTGVGCCCTVPLPACCADFGGFWRAGGDL